MTITYVHGLIATLAYWTFLDWTVRSSPSEEWLARKSVIFRKTNRANGLLFKTPILTFGSGVAKLPHFPLQRENEFSGRHFFSL